MIFSNDVTVSAYSFVFLVIVATVLTHSQAHVLEFTIEPTDTVVENGQSAVLDCMVKASQHQSTVLIQWLDGDRQKLTFSGDTYRSQLTNGSLYINSVSEELGLTGTYRCMATLPNIGSIVSRNATLSVASLSGFHDEPRDLTVFVGQKAYFACRVQALPQPKIKWLKDERPFHLDDLRMTILPSGALEIDEVVESDQGAYRCNASSLNSFNISSKAILKVIDDIDKATQITAPIFIAKPHREVVIEGQEVSLDCAANGYPKPSIKWLKNGVTIDMNDLDSRYSLVGTTSSLRITNIQESDAGTYQCRAHNKEDSEDASATVDVQVPPRFLVKPDDIIEFEKKDIQLNCSVYGKPVPKIEWLRNGEPLLPSDYYQIVNGHNLKIMGLVLGDSGLIQCTASNSAGNVQTSANVKVLKAESKKSKHKGSPKKVPPLEGSGGKLPKNQSFSLFSSLKSEKTAKLSDVDFSHLYQKPDLKNFNPMSAFSSLVSSDANDTAPDIEYFQANFPTYPKPISGQHGKKTVDGDVGVEIGPPQDLKAPVIKARFIILSWKPPTVNSESVEGYSVYYQQEGSERERIQNSSRSKLEKTKIDGLIPGRVYHFRVVPFSAKTMGQTSKTLTITTQAEEHVPSPPLSFEAYATGPRSIHVSWRPPENPIGLIEKYTVYYMETRSSIEHHIDTNELEWDFNNNLGVYTEYSIWVVAVNQNGPGAATEEKIVRTFGDIPSEAPFNVSIEAASTSLTVLWQPPPLTAQNGIITGYKIKIRKTGSKKAQTTTASANERMFVFNDLEKETAYQIRLWAMNTNGTGPPTDWYTAETNENVLDESKVPDKPGPLIVRPFSDKVYVTWTPPKNQGVKIRNYILGWGKGVPDMLSEELDDKTRSYMIERLEPNSEYVISLRASNQIGAGIPAYANVRTQDEPPPEPPQPLIPPIGLKAHVLSTDSVVLYWTDTTLGKTQIIKDNRYYVVKYEAEKSMKSKFLNVSDLNLMISDLKPNTLYEFSVKLVRGRKESPWSMVVTNSTWDTAPSAAPRDLDVHMTEDESQQVELSWQPPKMAGSRITGYIIFYTDNVTKSDREWSVLAIKGDKHTSIIPDLKPFTEYFFKIQARNSRGNGPFSTVVTFRTGHIVGLANSSRGQALDSYSIFSGDMLLYMIIVGCAVALTTVSIVTAFLCCRTKPPTATSPDRSKKGYQKGNQSIKPPDLWIHHDQMELKNLEKSHSSNDAASSSGALTLPRSVGGNDYDNHDNIHSSSLDKRTYVPSYMAIATPINTAGISQSSTDSTPSSRPPYPRTQYSAPRAHVTVDAGHPNSALIESPYASHPTNIPVGYEGSPSYISQPPPVAHVPSTSGYAPGMSLLAESQAGKRLQGQGHPLKSFTVPAPPPISAPGTPQAKHIVSQPQVTIRPNCSPFKKLPPASQMGGSRISASNPPPHTSDEIQRLQPSHSTEELNQEMANLEGLMLTLNAITANEFEC
ncbi:neogenin isoform X2 [Coccinella septempunctata]|uniref:neogenin isoform X2 n=1 Tax=Coccinella septempunctata TaxID=41139 RepID=UPI001D0762C4|nr:neogenin isoform X2 [Coccinella septempunctata]